MKASLVVVCHFSSGVLPRCVTSFRRQASAIGLETEVVVIEQSEDEGEASAAAECGPDSILRKPNRGYAAGLNIGMTNATGEVLFLANPDIEFLDGSVAALADAVSRGGDVVGPQLYWDSRGEVVLPIPDDPGPMAELTRVLRRRQPTRRDLVNRLEASWRVWTGEEPCEVPSLRGPLMVLGSETAQRFGPLDEGYFLYYEETEWLLRARRRGARLLLAPKSRVVHRWGHSTGRRPDQAQIEERSRTRFFRRNYPAPVRALLGWLSRRPIPTPRRFAEVGGPNDLPEIPANVWLLSIVSQMEPFVGCLETPRLPPAALDLTRRGRWYAVAAGLEGRRWRQLGSWMWESND